VRAQLEETGRFDVLGEAATGLEGLRLVERLHPEAVVLDYSMPQMNGLDAAMAIERRWPEISVVMLTGSDFDLDAQLLLVAHTTALLSKRRYDATTLVTALLDAGVPPRLDLH
jgi:DNA-binding NarL/FixJ family response regulator